jgi:hypothetical protein
MSEANSGTTTQYKTSSLLRGDFSRRVVEQRVEKQLRELQLELAISSTTLFPKPIPRPTKLSQPFIFLHQKISRCSSLELSRAYIFVVLHNLFLKTGPLF